VFQRGELKGNIMRHLIEFLLLHIVENPADLNIEEVDGEYRKIYQVSANSDDIGRIIGHQGKTIKAVRRVATILAMDLNERFEIEIVD
jgi:predicted RNA-binding protein YlqC (UPF0109 family)